MINKRVFVINRQTYNQFFTIFNGYIFKVKCIISLFCSFFCQGACSDILLGSNSFNFQRTSQLITQNLSSSFPELYPIFFQ